MILIELTEKEFELIKLSIEEKKAESVKNYETNHFEADRKAIEFCDSIIGKLDLAAMAKDDVVIKINDLFFIKSLAVQEYGNLTLPLHLSEKQVEQRDLVHVALIKSLISWLNGNNLLKKLVKFDVTDDSTSYESIEE